MSAPARKTVPTTRRVVAYFVEHAGQSVTQQQLMQATGLDWGQVNHCILAIRKGAAGQQLTPIAPGARAWIWDKDHPRHFPNRSAWDQDEDEPQEQEQAAQEQSPPAPILPRLGQLLEVVHIIAATPSPTVIVRCEDERRYAATLVAL